MIQIETIYRVRIDWDVNSKAERASYDRMFRECEIGDLAPPAYPDSCGDIVRSIDEVCRRFDVEYTMTGAGPFWNAYLIITSTSYEATKNTASMIADVITSHPFGILMET